jgi:hypothetical protein
MNLQDGSKHHQKDSFFFFCSLNSLEKPFHNFCHCVLCVDVIKNFVTTVGEHKQRLVCILARFIKSLNPGLFFW